MTSSTLQIASRATSTTARDTVSTAEPHPPTAGQWPTGLASVSAPVSALARASQPDYFAWLDHISPAAGCTRPVRLTGDLYTVARRHDGTATVLGVSSTRVMPDGVIYKACGSRLASVCPACARTYQYDAYQILRAFLVGGKGVPTTVANHPAVFPTLTAPSFGLVHTRNVAKHTCTRRSRCDCRPDPCRARTHGDTGGCRHGQPTVCFARHDPDDPRLGQPFCLDCYDHDHQVVWNHYAPELWRRTKQEAERHLERLARSRGIPSPVIHDEAGRARRVSPVQLGHGKTAEMQRRGVVHYHALLRLDATNPADPKTPLPPPAGFTSADIDHAIRHAAATVAFTTPPHPDRPAGWPIAWGDQIEVIHITIDGSVDLTDDIADDMAAGYLAKYATKSTEVTGHHSGRLHADTIDAYADPDGGHTARLIDACWRLGRSLRTPQPLSCRPIRPRRAARLRSRWACTACGTTTRLAVCPTCPPVPPPADTNPSTAGRDAAYTGLRRWAHRFGFGGHFLTKTRRGCPTFGLLRGTRITYRRTRDRDRARDSADAVIRTADHTDEETTLTVGLLTFAGTGWHTTGDALLANTAAALARERRAAGRAELAHEIGTTSGHTTQAA